MPALFRPDYFKFPCQCFGKLHDGISESYYTSSDSDVAGFFEVNISKLTSRFLPASTAHAAMINDTGLNQHSLVLEKIVKLKVLNILINFLFFFVANMYG